MPGWSPERRARREAKEAALVLKSNNYTPDQKMIDLWQDSVNKRQQAAEDFKPLYAELVEATKALAFGHMIEGTDRKGEPVVYTKSPDINAIKLIFNMMNFDTKENADILLARHRMIETNQRIERDVAGAQARQMEAQAKFTLTQDSTYEKSLIDRDLMEKAVTAIMSRIIGYLQAIPIEVMRDDYCAEESRYRMLMTRIGEVGTEELASILEIEEDE